MEKGGSLPPPLPLLLPPPFSECMYILRLKVKLSQERIWMREFDLIYCILVSE